ncbi:MAG: PfkB family carbohydrate kinase [Dehalococcoidia bacterium]|jgi:hypothetical protein|nr:PfkB family carbohydrate kinase [Dehalococcoidia bacterium]|tara:strand:+ start:3780 stop:4664 length:885 start_codon:yes stop_codon:yes gene_type:complete
MSDLTTPDFLSIGVVTYDVTPEPGLPHGRVRSGGAAAFGALCAQALGLKAAVVTSAAPDYPVGSILPGIPLHVVGSKFTTFFQNVYDLNGERTQVLGGRSSSITRSDIPPAWLDAPIVFFGPLVHETPPDANRWFPDAVVGAAIQGWLRRWDDYGRVTEDTDFPAGVSDGYRLLAGSTTEFPVDNEAEMSRWAACTEVLGVTDGSNGVRIYVQANGGSPGAPSRVPGYAATELDPTGAGDIWAAACLVRLAETGNSLEAARFANAAASVSVEREGLSGSPDRAEIAARLARGPA